MRKARTEWTTREIYELTLLYSTPGVIDLQEFADKTGRLVSNVSRKARELGLPTNYCHPKKRKPVNQLSKASRQKLEHDKRTPEEQKAFISAVRKKAIKEHGHPRGGRETRICPVCSKSFEVRNSSPVRHCSSKCGRIGRPAETIFSRGKGGRRADLNNQYFRSSYEANYARYLNWMIKNNGGGIVRWEFEPETFWFLKIMRGVRSYKPDFKVYYANGKIEYHEVKGWDYARGRTARKRMAKYYPNIKLILIDADFFKALKRQGIDALIEWWE